MPTTDLRDILDVCVDAALVAGKRTLAYFQTGVQPDWKEDDTPVTVADREAERVLRERILASFPCLLYTSPSPRDGLLSRMPSSA